MWIRKGTFPGWAVGDTHRSTHWTKDYAKAHGLVTKSEAWFKCPTPHYPLGQYSSWLINTSGLMQSRLILFSCHSPMPVGWLSSYWTFRDPGYLPLSYSDNTWIWSPQDHQGRGRKSWRFWLGHVWPDLGVTYITSVHLPLARTLAPTWLPRRLGNRKEDSNLFCLEPRKL